MKRSRHWRRRCMGGWAVLVLVVALVGVLAGCDDQPSPAQSPSFASGTGVPLSPGAAAAWTRVEVGAAETVHRSAQRLSLPYREYRRSGSWRVPDLTDCTAALMKNAGEHQQLWLMDLSSGKTRQIFARATTTNRGFWIGTVHLSDSWLAWEEVGPGDDLVEPVDWRLYAASLHHASLTIGKPQLIASASNTEATRPLFDVSGSNLGWVSTARSSSGTATHSQLTVRDLASGQRRVLYRSRGVLATVNFRGSQVVVGEIPHLNMPNTRFAVLDLGSGKRVAGFDVANEHAVSHWPAWRDGWLGWAPFPSADATYPLLYLRNPSGRVYTDSGFAVDPCFVGPYLFFQASRRGAPWQGTTVEVLALRLSDMTSFVLEQGNQDQGDWWCGTVGSPELKQTYIAYLDRAYMAEKQSDKVTIIRVYDVR